MRFISRFIAPLLLACALPVHADVIADFKVALTNLQSIQGDFTQTVTTKSGKKQISNGDFAIQRPGKFRWNYRKPYEQLIVGDGKEIWLFDPDLNQVTVKSVDKALEASPAALLSGDNQIEKRYTLKALPERDGLAWIEAIPKQNDSNFNRVRMGFAQNSVQKMELEDNFGQSTQVELRTKSLNSKPSAALFQFTPPKGADVVRQ